MVATFYYLCHMKVFQSSIFRALCAIVVGALLVKYREQTVTWITIAIGVIFFVSGVISTVAYLSAKRQATKEGGIEIIGAIDAISVIDALAYPCFLAVANRCLP